MRKIKQTRRATVIESLESRTLLSNSTIGTAVDLGAVGTSGSVTNSGTAGTSNPDIFYKFSISSIRDVTVSMQMSSGQAELEFIRDANGNGVIDSGDVLEDHFTNSTVTEHQRLSSGTYFARVFNPSSSAGYSVTVVAPSASSDPGQTLLTGKDLGSVGTSGSVSKSDWVGSADSEDDYKFKTSSIGDVTVSMTMTSGQAELEFIRDANGNGIIDSGDVLSDHFTNSTVAEHQRLPAGTYFARVFNPSEDAFYSLTVVAPSAAADPGQTLLTGKDLGSVGTSGSVSNSDWVGSGDSEDDYKFSISSTRDVTVSMTMTSGQAELEFIRDANGNGNIDSGDVLSDHFTNSTVTEHQRLPAGTYFARVFNPSEDAFYTFTVVAPSAAADPGNTLATAQNINGSTGDTPITDWVGSADGEDDYKFTIASSTTVTASMQMNSGQAELQFIKDVNGNKLIDSGDVLDDHFTNSVVSEKETLGAGTYYVRVFNPSEDAFYSLAVTGPLVVQSTPTVAVTASDASASFTGTNTGAFTFSRTGSTSSAMTINYTVSGTATNGTDYNTISSSVTIPAGKSSATVTITPKDGTKPSKTAIVTIKSSSNYTINSAETAAIVNIAGTTPAISIVALDPNASETPVGPTSTGEFVVSRTGSTSAALTLSVTLSGTATHAKDYNVTVEGASSSSYSSTTKKLTLTIPAGKSAVAIIVTPLNDSVAESTETVIATLNSVTGFGITAGMSSAIVDIADWTA